MEFDLFKSGICHIYKNIGLYYFVSEIVSDDWISYFWDKQWFAESFYTLAMLNFLKGGKVMKLLIEAEVSDKDANELKRMGYDIDFPCLTNVTLDYGDKVVYGYGRVKTDECEIDLD